MPPKEHTAPSALIKEDTLYITDPNINPDELMRAIREDLPQDVQDRMSINDMTGTYGDLSHLQGGGAVEDLDEHQFPTEEERLGDAVERVQVEQALDATRRGDNPFATGDRIGSRHADIEALGPQFNDPFDKTLLQGSTQLVRNVISERDLEEEDIPRTKTSAGTFKDGNGKICAHCLFHPADEHDVVKVMTQRWDKKEKKMITSIAFQEDATEKQRKDFLDFLTKNKEWMADGHSEKDFMRWSIYLSEYGVQQFKAILDIIGALSKSQYGQAFYFAPIDVNSHMAMMDAIGSSADDNPFWRCPLQTQAHIGEFQFYDENKDPGFQAYQLTTYENGGRKIWMTCDETHFPPSSGAQWVKSINFRGKIDDDHWTTFTDALEGLIKEVPGLPLLIDPPKEDEHGRNWVGKIPTADIREEQMNNPALLDDPMKNCCCCSKSWDCAYGHNPLPYMKKGRCCDKCNMEKVIPMRRAMIGLGEVAVPEEQMPELKALTEMISGLQQDNVRLLARADMNYKANLKRMKKTPSPEMFALIQKKEREIEEREKKCQEESARWDEAFTEVKATTAGLNQKVKAMDLKAKADAKIVQKHENLKKEVAKKDAKLANLGKFETLAEDFPLEFWKMRMTPVLPAIQNQGCLWQGARGAFGFRNQACPIHDQNERHMRMKGWVKEDYMIAHPPKAVKSPPKKKRASVKCQCLICERMFPKNSMVDVNGDLLCKKCA